MKHSAQSFDVVVIGGGHAGCEAAAAAARMGATTLLLTASLATVGAMSCNPSIGGVGKGHLVREIDVFGGLMGRAADQAAIHYRMLNRSKGSAVRGPRVQADRALYAAAIKRMLAAETRLTLRAAMVIDVALETGGGQLIKLENGEMIATRTVVLATGTFLNGKLFQGLSCVAGGRVAEPAAEHLGNRLRERVAMRRLKTGTPPRLDGRTIDWSRVTPQPSDREPWTMSWRSTGRPCPQLFCATTTTTEQTREVVHAGLDRSPLYGGVIQGQGPRYCPSIEDKIVRFPDRQQHNIFLEPEGLDDSTIYPNGISTSLPLDVQERLVATLPGLEAARIVQPGYAVEYDALDPRILTPHLMLRDWPGLYCAGQINGTTGYEEAAAQGLCAGLNAAASALGRGPIGFQRSESYLGVMIDDLTLQGASEPYRMLTSRAESRLHLRADNAIQRLGGIALAVGAVVGEQAAALEERLASLASGRAVLASVATTGLSGDDAPSLLRDQPQLAPFATLLPELLDDRLYAPYVDRQRREAARAQEVDASLASIGSFQMVHGLSREMVERLELARPSTLAEARRIRGITPAALTAILVAARRAAA